MSQLIGWEDPRGCDLKCVQWDVKTNYIIAYHYDDYEFNY